MNATSTNTISRWENGKLSPPMAYLEWLASRAGLPVRVLVEGSSDAVTREAIAFREVAAVVDRWRATESPEGRGDGLAELEKQSEEARSGRGHGGAETA